MLNDFIHIRNRLENVSISDNEIEGSLSPNSDEIEQLIQLSDNDCIDSHALVGKNHISINKIEVGHRVSIKLYPSGLNTEKYYESFEELIKSSRKVYPNKRFYVRSLDFDSDGGSLPSEIVWYKATTKLIAFLKDISDYQKEDELVFFQSKQLVLTTDYDNSDLTPLTGLDELIDHIQNSADKEERRIIFINELITSLLSIAEIKNRFRHLIKNFDDLTSNYRKSHSLYLEKYSYQKFKSEIDKEAIEYSKKIQSVINDAQSKLVAIPVAFLLIIGQFDLTGEKIFFNFALILSAIVFAVLLEVLLRNQFSALDFIDDDVKRFKNSVEEKKVAILGTGFTQTFKKIQTQYNQQKTYLNIIRFLVWLTPVFATTLFVISLTNNTLICVLRRLLSRLYH